MLFLRRYFVGDIFGFVSQEWYVQVEVILFCLKQYIENSFGRRERQRVEFYPDNFIKDWFGFIIQVRGLWKYINVGGNVDFYGEILLKTDLVLSENIGMWKWRTELFFQSYLRIRKSCFRIQERYVEVDKITGKRYFSGEF